MKLGERLELFNENRAKIEESCREDIERQKRIIDDNTKSLHDSLIKDGVDPSEIDLPEPDYEKAYRNLIQEEINHCYDEE